MPNIITAAGLQVATQTEYIEQFTAAMEDIYGSDINLEQSTPDGQMMMIYIQTALDVLDLLVNIYNMFDPDNAIGVVLDQRVAINGIQRRAGTHTIQNVTVTVDRALNIYGLDQDVEPVYTVSDSEGNEFVLVTSHVFSGSGSASLVFQALLPGEVLTIPNTITVPVTVVLGVVSVNNPLGATSIGVNEETDAELRLRRQKSVSLASQGYYAGLMAALLNIDGVTSSYIYENDSDSTDGDGVPSHSIWVIVSGGDPNDIADAIYRKRNAGCGMKGSEIIIISQQNGNPVSIKWDYVDTEALFIEFDASSLDGTTPPNTALILDQLPLIFVPGVYEQVNINDLATLVQDIDNNTLVTNAGFSLTEMGIYTPKLTPSAKNKQFSVTSGNINITVV